MPLLAHITPPRRKNRKTKDTSKSKLQFGKNYDEELRQYLATTSQQIPDVGDASAGILNSSVKMPFSKDFGSFDLTICTTEDEKCVVLVKYERRIFINGVQIYISQDGRVCDSHGRHDVTLQTCYDCALKIRRALRKTSSMTTNSKEFDRMDRDVPDVKVHDDAPKDRCSDVESLNDSKYESAIDQWGLPEPYKRRISLEDELKTLEEEFNQIITSMCTLILELSDHENTDTESAHSDGETRCIDQRQLLHEVLRRFSYQFQSVVELSSNLEKQMSEIDDDGDDENSDASSVTSDAFTDHTSSTISINYGNARKFRSSETPAWIHDKKSWKHEKARLNAELGAARSKHRRLQRRHEELQMQFEEIETTREDFQEKLSKYMNENKELKQRCTHLETAGFPCDDVNSESKAQGHVEKYSNTFCDDNLEFQQPDEIETQSRRPTAKRRGTKMFSRKHVPLGNKAGKLLKSEMIRLRSVADDMEDNVSMVMKENVALRVRINQLERDGRDLKERLRVSETMVSSIKSDMTCLDKRNVELETKCDILERERANGETEIERTSNIIVEMRSQYRTLEREYTELEKAVKILSTDKLQQRDELDNLERSKIEAKNNCSLLAKDNADLQASLAQLKREKSNLESDLRLVQEELDSTCAAKTEVEESQRAIMNELNQMKNAQMELSEQIVRLQETAAVAEKRCKGVQEQNEELVGRTQDLENQNESLENRTRSLSNTGRLLEVENSELKQMLRRMRSESADMKTKIVTLAKTNADFRTKVEQWDRENASVEGKMRSLVRAKTDLQNIIRQMASDANNHFETMDIECAQLREQQQRSKTQLVTDVDAASALSTVALDI